MTLTPVEAELVLREAHAQGITVNLPEDAKEKVKQAEQVISQAEAAFSSGVKGEHVTRILSIRDALSPAPLENSTNEDMESYGSNLQDPQKDSGAHVAGHEEPTPNRKAATDMIEAQGLPIPPYITEDPPEMPRDLTDVGDRELRRLHSIYNSYLNRVSYLLGIERADEKAANRLLDHESKRALREVPKQYDDARPKPQHVLLAEAAGDPEVIKWDDRVAQHEANLSMLYTMRDIYSNNVERISKEWRMRLDAWHMEGGTRG